MNSGINRAEKIFKSACAFSKASYLLNDKALMTPFQDKYLGLTSTVNAAFALELYFKLLYYLEKGHDFKNKNNSYSHDFYELFKQLSNSTKHEIELKFIELLKNRDMADVEGLEKESNMQMPRDLNGNLNAWKDIFVKIRYFFDARGEGFRMVFFPEIEASVLVSIFRLKPEWKR